MAAFVWIFIIDRVTIVQEYTYMLMLSLVFGLYAVTEFVRGNGGIAVFVFGIIIGNARKIAKFAKFEWENPITRTTRLFQEEVTFFVRTFFFTYIGLLLSLDYFSLPVILFTIAVLAIVVLSRCLIQRLLMKDLPLRDRGIIVTMVPRGLAAAVLATIPITKGIDLPNFQEIVFSVLLFSNVAATLGIFIYDREEKKNSEQQIIVPKQVEKAKGRKSSGKKKK